MEEVYPVCRSNLFSPAGEWAGFDSDWLESSILRRVRSPFHRWRLFSLGRFTVHLSLEWRQTKAGVFQRRAQTGPGAHPSMDCPRLMGEESGAHDLGGKLRRPWYFDWFADAHRVEEELVSADRSPACMCIDIHRGAPNQTLETRRQLENAVHVPPRVSGGWRWHGRRLSESLGCSTRHQ